MHYSHIIIKISDITKFPEILDGRVKTLHPKILGSLLCKYDNNDHLKELEVYRSYKLQEKWKLEFDWHYGHELEWNYKSKKKAEEHMEYIKDFFGPKLVESIKNIKITKYVIGKGGVKHPPSTS